MKNYFKYFNLLGLAAFVLIFFNGCETDNAEDPIEKIEFNIKVIDNGGFGKIMVNQDNQSIYFFAGDVSGESNCKGGCADVWPPVIGEVYDLQLGSYLSKNDFSTITREDGQKQLTYKGWPLYYFSPDGNDQLEEPREVLGDGRGGVFHVAKPDYSVLLGRQPVSEGEEAVVYLVNDRGVTLYLNQGDEENISNCNGGCATVWPPFQKTQPVIPSSLNANDFEYLNRNDELGPQLSFKGSPLYYFSQDEEKQGVVLGQAGGPNQTFFVVETEEQ